MPLDDIRRVLELGRESCAERGLILGIYTGYEPLAHPQAAELLRLVAQYNQVKSNIFPTNGIALAMRDDWREVLQVVRETGYTHLWFTLHGIGKVHDRIANRPGAFREMCLAIERGREAGLECEGNLFLTKANIPQFDQLIGEANPIKPGLWLWEIANFQPTPRLRRYEALRPELADLQPFADVILSHATYNQEKWSRLESLTEAAYVRQALDEGSESAWLPYQDAVHISLACTHTLDIYAGAFNCRGYYGKHLGNLKDDDAREILRRAIDADPVPYEDIFFPDAKLPSVRELASTIADPQGQKLYFNRGNMRVRWLDLALNNL